MTAQEKIKKFLEGEIDIIDFRKMYDEDKEINDFLQGIIDRIKENSGSIEPFPFHCEDRIGCSTESVEYLLDPDSDPGLEYCPPQYESVRQMLTYNFRLITHDVRSSDGANLFYNQVLVIYYQYDKDVKEIYRYYDMFLLGLDAIPEYLMGGEAELYIQKEIIPLVPEELPKAKKIKAIKAKIKEEFKTEKGYPQWYQMSEWPLGKNGKPCTYIGKDKKAKGELGRWFFRDESDGEIIAVEQYY